MEIRRIQKRPQSRNTHQFTENDAKDIKQENAGPRLNAWFLLQESRVHTRQTSTRNEQMPTRSTRTRMDDERKNPIDSKGPEQRNNYKNYRPITCLPIMWKILTKQIREQICLLLTNRRLFPEKGCRKGSRGKSELLNNDQHILNESKTRGKNSYGLDFLQSWKIKYLKMCKILHEIINFIEEFIKNLES